MFTGLVEALAPVADVVPEGPGKRLVLRHGEIAAGASIGESIAINGCCLTVIAVAVDDDDDTLAFQAGEETLSRTNLGELSAGDAVNLERSLKLNAELGGHFVTGHIDAVGTLDERIDDGDWSTCWFRMPAALATQIVSKGSIAVDGVSLTVVDVEPERFSVALIPHTLNLTTLGRLAVGGRVNLETDLLAKYVQKQITAMRGENTKS
ncbi:MAG: riboflavin synthase [Planctomycetes bacterium]|nr:riboflavin synthase [Planctomycetota bacterium]